MTYTGDLVYFHHMSSLSHQTCTHGSQHVHTVANISRPTVDLATDLHAYGWPCYWPSCVSSCPWAGLVGERTREPRVWCPSASCLSHGGGRGGQGQHHPLSWNDADKHIVKILKKVYIERNNMQLELIRYGIKCWHYSRLLLRSDVFNEISPTERKSTITTKT